MMMRYQNLMRGLFVLSLSVSMLACASIPELKVDYQLPPRSDQLRGKKVALSIEDGRATKKLFGPGAEQDFAGFSGNISFSVARFNEPGFKIGIFNLFDLIREGFKRKLENLGMQVLPEPMAGEPQLVLVINDFELDLVDRKWVARVGYDARLVRDGQILSSQTISGQAERLKIMGRGGADKVMGEIFTEMVNRLDMLWLYRQANLLG
jgi:hypothetical protein